MDRQMGSTSAQRKASTRERACKECKRLKLKCDKNFPCSNCTKRGCSAICPDGELVTGRGSRFILSGSEQLYEKNCQLTERIRELEQALKESAKEGGRHVLLSEDRMRVKSHIDLVIAPRPSFGAEEEEERRGGISPPHSHPLHHIPHTNGRRPHHPHSPTTSYSPHHQYSHPPPPPPAPLDLSQTLLLLALPSPFLPTPPHSLLPIHVDLGAYIPPAYEVSRIVRVFTKSGSWIFGNGGGNGMWTIEGKSVDIEEWTSYVLQRPSGMDLATVYAVLALGAGLDVEEEKKRPTQTKEHAQGHGQGGREWYQLSRACLGLLPGSASEKERVRVLMLLALFLTLDAASSESDIREAGVLLDGAVRLAVDCELPETDPGLWKDLVAFETCWAMDMERVPSVGMFGSAFGSGKGKEISGDGERFRTWLHTFTQSTLLPLLSPSASSSMTTVEIDDALRRSYVPPELKIPIVDTVTVPGQEGVMRDDVGVVFQRGYVGGLRALACLKLHLPSLTTNGGNTEAVYKASRALVACLRYVCGEAFQLVCRFRVFWKWGLVAGVPLALIASRNTSALLPPSQAEKDLRITAARELDLLLDMYEGAAGFSIYARSRAGMVRGLRERARTAVAAFGAVGGKGKERDVDMDVERERERRDMRSPYSVSGSRSTTRRSHSRSASPAGREDRDRERYTVVPPPPSQRDRSSSRASQSHSSPHMHGHSQTCTHSTPSRECLLHGFGMHGSGPPAFPSSMRLPLPPTDRKRREREGGEVSKTGAGTLIWPPYILAPDVGMTKVEGGGGGGGEVMGVAQARRVWAVLLSEVGLPPDAL